MILLFQKKSIIVWEGPECVRLLKTIYFRVKIIFTINIKVTALFNIQSNPDQTPLLNIWLDGGVLCIRGDS